MGWISVPKPEDFQNFEQGWNQGTLAWETGTGQASLLYGLKASLELLTALGVTQSVQYLEELTDHLCDRLQSGPHLVLSSRLAGEKSQIVCIKPASGMSAMALYVHLKKKNIITAPRGDRLRIAPHVYNTPEEIAALVEALP